MKQMRGYPLYLVLAVLVGLGTGLMLSASGTTGPLEGVPPIPPGALCPIGTPTCKLPGCSPAISDPAMQAVCCADHPSGAGCCSYTQVTTYHCHDAQGRRCYCGTVADLGGGSCKRGGLPDPFTTCDAAACSSTRGQCR